MFRLGRQRIEKGLDLSYILNHGENGVRNLFIKSDRHELATDLLLRKFYFNI